MNYDEMSEIAASWWTNQISKSVPSRVKYRNMKLQSLKNSLVHQFMNTFKDKHYRTISCDTEPDVFILAALYMVHLKPDYAPHYVMMHISDCSIEVWIKGVKEVLYIR